MRNESEEKSKLSTSAIPCEKIMKALNECERELDDPIGHAILIAKDYFNLVQDLKSLDIPIRDALHNLEKDFYFYLSIGESDLCG
jgi:hypothetical protein